MNPKVDFYFAKAKRWQEEIKALRTIVLDCGLNEELKWGSPCYTYEKGNIVLIHVFKGYCAFLFFKGALLKDTDQLLVQQTENVQSARQIRFTGLQDILKKRTVLRSYIQQALDVEKAGLKVRLKTTADYKVPEEFKHKLDQLPALQAAFKALTPGRQRAYLFYFSGAKLAKTREMRVEKCIPQILKGKGLED